MAYVITPRQVIWANSKTVETYFPLTGWLPTVEWAAVLGQYELLSKSNTNLIVKPYCQFSNDRTITGSWVAVPGGIWLGNTGVITGIKFADIAETGTETIGTQVRFGLGCLFDDVVEDAVLCYARARIVAYGRS